MTDAHYVGIVGHVWFAVASVGRGPWVLVSLVLGGIFMVLALA